MNRTHLIRFAIKMRLYRIALDLILARRVERNEMGSIVLHHWMSDQVTVWG